MKQKRYDHRLEVRITGIEKRLAEELAYKQRTTVSQLVRGHLRDEIAENIKRKRENEHGHSLDR